MARPDLSRCPEWYHNYIKQTTTDNLIQALEDQRKDQEAFLKSLPAEKWDYAYAPGKWTIREVVQHIIDAERVFVFRALSFSRMDSTPLPGFDENDWAANMDCGKRSISDLMQELNTLRQSTILFFASLSPKQLDASGIANNNSQYVEAIGFVVAGHAAHHIKILRERY